MRRRGCRLQRVYRSVEQRPVGLLPGRLALSFSTDREGNIASVAVPFELLVKDIAFNRIAAGDGTSPPSGMRVDWLP